MSSTRVVTVQHLKLRPGRIDSEIEFLPPNVEARQDILKIHSRRMNWTRGINLMTIAEQMGSSPGFEVKGVCTEACIYALRERRVHVNQEDCSRSRVEFMDTVRRVQSISNILS